MIKDWKEWFNKMVKSAPGFRNLVIMKEKKIKKEGEVLFYFVCLHIRRTNVIVNYELI